MALVGLPTSLERNLFSTDDVQSPPKRQKRTLADSTELKATQFVELDLIDDESEDEGEIMLLAMILLQIHGVKLSASQELDHNKKKRQRTSPEQLAILETIFQTDKMPSQQTRIHLADQLGMSSRRVQIWFQNKRAKVKRGLGKSSDSFGEPSSPLDDFEDDPTSRRNSLSCSSSSISAYDDSSSPVSTDSHTLSLSNLSALSHSVSPLKSTQLLHSLKETHDHYNDAIKV
eukprot:TRINITY_DN26287_c0_g1_i1.p1 TRINITY_DN26287_c0_g1~~TRINITY_DN26287_c0_g1_i1.p1  ORF type:complete len:231 (+),score=23.64 TRINITY_DN26287_c0_g1_i1:599-1291(+)